MYLATNVFRKDTMFQGWYCKTQNIGEHLIFTSFVKGRSGRLGASLAALNGHNLSCSLRIPLSRIKSIQQMGKIRKT